MDKEMCMERKNEMKKYIRKEAKKKIMIDIYEECKMQCVQKERDEEMHKEEREEGNCKEANKERIRKMCRKKE